MIKYFVRNAFIASLITLQIANAENPNQKVLSISEIFKLAHENSKILKIANTNINISRNQTQIAKNTRLPSVNIGLSMSYLGNATIFDRNLSNSFKAEMPHLGNNFVIEASELVYAGGAISNSIDLAELNEQLSKLNYDKNESDIRLMLIGYYLNLNKLINQKEVYLKNVMERKELIKQIEAKRQEGMALNNDVSRHLLSLNNLELSIKIIDNQIKILNEYLTTLIGIPNNIEILPDTNIANIIRQNFNLDDIKNIAKKNLPELLSAEIGIKKAETNINIAKSEFYPSLAIIAANHLDGPITFEVPTINKNINYWYLGVGLKYNLSSIFTSDKKVDLAENGSKIADEMKSFQDEQAMLLINASFIEYNESFDKLNNFQKSLDLANENYSVINNKYLNEIALITDILDASSSKLDAELQLANGKIDIIFNYYKLQHSIGKL